MARYIVYTAALTASITAADEHDLAQGPTGTGWPGQIRCVSYPDGPITLAAGHAACLAAVDHAPDSRGVIARVITTDPRMSIAIYSRDLPARLVTLARAHVTGARDVRDLAGTEIHTPAPDRLPARDASIAVWSAYRTYAARPDAGTATTLARAAHALLLGRPPRRVGPTPEPVALDPDCSVRTAVHEVILAADVAGLAAPEQTGPALAELLLALGITTATRAA
ncbi:hypothetical protein [Embleya sp. NPDC005971]|uniref:hypothetical protein n=1 Tax=Embleya sp. NPDC005971 TaxID=3156724 RepID=UPI003405303E